MIRHTLISLEAEFFTPSCTLWVYDGCLNFSVQSLVLKKKNWLFGPFGCQRFHVSTKNCCFGGCLKRNSVPCAQTIVAWNNFETCKGYWWTFFLYCIANCWSWVVVTLKHARFFLTKNASVMSMMENTLDRFCVSQGWTSKNKTVKHFLIRRIDNCRSLELSCLKLFFGTSPLWSGFFGVFFWGVQKLWVPSLYKSDVLWVFHHHLFIESIRHDLTTWLDMTWGAQAATVHGTGNSNRLLQCWELGIFFGGSTLGFFVERAPGDWKGRNVISSQGPFCGVCRIFLFETSGQHMFLIFVSRRNIFQTKNSQQKRCWKFVGNFSRCVS